MFSRKNVNIAQYRMSRCFELTGEILDIKCEDKRIERITFTDNESLKVVFEKDEYTTQYYCSKIDDYVYFIHFDIPTKEYHNGMSIAYDKKSGYLTAVHAKYGHVPENPKKVEHDIIFCVVGDKTFNSAECPHFTDILVGHEFEYRYGEGFIVQHNYLSEHKFQWTIVLEKTCPQFLHQPHIEYCDVVEITPDVLLFSWLETDSGVQGAFLLNTTHMRNTGAFFGVSPDGSHESYPMGAFAVFKY